MASHFSHSQNQSPYLDSNPLSPPLPVWPIQQLSPPMPCSSPISLLVIAWTPRHILALSLLCSCNSLGSQGGAVVKNLPASGRRRKWCVWSLGWEDPLEEGMATHSSILAWRIPWTEEPGRLHTVHGLQRVRHGWVSTSKNNPLPHFFHVFTQFLSFQWGSPWPLYLKLQPMLPYSIQISYPAPLFPPQYSAR